VRIRLLAVGRSRDEAVNSLVARYAGRCPWAVELVEVVPRRGDDEAQALLKALAPDSISVALDERGRELTTAEFARTLGGWRDEGRNSVDFIIGGAEGLTPALRRRADLVLSLGRMTWPHLLVRAMLAEQLYRASSILAGHPYHRD